MGKDKLRRFAENLTFKNLVQPEHHSSAPHSLKGSWGADFFGNSNPIVLELGCGKGEYTVDLARRNPDKNYIGIDIKGARMWRGAKTATDENIPNAGFLRTHIEQIDSYFSENEVDEIWITFPDPQLKSRRARKRLTAPLFLSRYAAILKPGGRIHLKTDSQHLHAYTRALLDHYGLKAEAASADLYKTAAEEEATAIQTAYERAYLDRGLPITYVRFRLDDRKSFPPFVWEGDAAEEKDNEPQRCK